jgi:CRISPR-associated exonuclease Cas4
VCDLRQWTYCPRVVYWRVLVPLATPETHKMKAGREEESLLAALEERRGLRRYGVGVGRRTFDVWLSLSGARWKRRASPAAAPR